MIAPACLCCFLRVQFVCIIDLCFSAGAALGQVPDRRQLGRQLRSFRRYLLRRPEAFQVVYYLLPSPSTADSSERARE